MSNDELVFFHGSCNDQADRDAINVELNDRRDTRNENFSSQRVLPNPNSNKVPSDDELKQDSGLMTLGSGDSGESYSSCSTLHHTTTNQQEASSSSNLTIERVCDEIKLEPQEAEEDNMKLKMKNQLQLREDFFEQHRFELDKETLNKENE